MATQLITFRLRDGGAVFVEANLDRDDLGTTGRNDIIEARQTFEQALSNVKTVADAVLREAMMLTNRPNEVAIELGISLKANAGVILAKNSGEGSFKLTIKWKSGERRASANPSYSVHRDGSVHRSRKNSGKSSVGPGS